MIQTLTPQALRVLLALERAGIGGITTKEIEDVAQVAAARDYVRRLRDKGYSIETRDEGRNKNNARVVRYILHRSPCAAPRSAPLVTPTVGSLSLPPGAAQGELFR